MKSHRTDGLEKIMSSRTKRPTLRSFHEPQKKIIKPQEGFQEKFLSSSADIVIAGAAAGVGKSYALLLDPLRYRDVPGWGGTTFRRTSTQILAEGGLWDTSALLYKDAG